MIQSFSGPCPVCGAEDLSSSSVLWPDLIEAWQLSVEEVAYIDRQQGFHCRNCSNNLRSMALAAAIIDEYKFVGTFHELCTSGLSLQVLEINRAGNLTTHLQKLKGHTLIEYPAFDMQSLSLASDSYDLILHSDTLEHVPNPLKGLEECYRVLRMGGKCIFTVPIIVDRMSRSRVGLIDSYHGSAVRQESDQLVYTEFGADFWKTVVNAGFRHCDLYSLEYPAGLAVIARKS